MPRHGPARFGHPYRLHHGSEPGAAVGVAAGQDERERAADRVAARSILPIYESADGSRCVDGAGPVMRHEPSSRVRSGSQSTRQEFLVVPLSRDRQSSSGRKSLSW